jgi:hypothetical protein
VKKKIQVRLQGGAIREIRGIPADYTVEVLDYDINRKDMPELSTDEHHRMCVISEWRATEGEDRSQSMAKTDKLRTRESK